MPISGQFCFYCCCCCLVIDENVYTYFGESRSKCPVSPWKNAVSTYDKEGYSVLFLIITYSVDIGSIPRNNISMCN